MGQPRKLEPEPPSEAVPGALRTRVIEQTPTVFITLVSVLIGLVLSDLVTEARSRMQLWPLGLSPGRLPGPARPADGAAGARPRVRAPADRRGPGLDVLPRLARGDRRPLGAFLGGLELVGGLGLEVAGLVPLVELARRFAE